MNHVIAELGISERRTCRALDLHRSTQRKIPTTPDEEAMLVANIIAFARLLFRNLQSKDAKYTFSQEFYLENIRSGSQLTISGIFQIRTIIRISMKKNGSVAVATKPRLRPDSPCNTNRFSPTGGVI